MDAAGKLRLFMQTPDRFAFDIRLIEEEEKEVKHIIAEDLSSAISTRGTEHEEITS